MEVFEKGATAGLQSGHGSDTRQLSQLDCEVRIRKGEKVGAA